jgi:hypothetical protein
MAKLRIVCPSDKGYHLSMKRLKYVSRYARDLTDTQLEALTRQAAEKNAGLDVTGILISSGRLFIQVLEGPAAAVDGIFARIREDSRHRDVLVLDVEEDCAERLFPDWSMRRFSLDVAAAERMEPLREILETVMEHRERIQSLTAVLERSLWAELANLAEEPSVVETDFLGHDG